MAEPAGNFFSMPGQGRQEPVLGVTHIYKLEAHQTSSGLACIELTVPAGQGVPPHIHTKEDEVFYVLSGAVEISGKDTAPVRLERGALFHGPRGHLHGFHNPGPAEALLLVLLMPGSNIQEMFAELSALTIAPTPPTPDEVAALCEKFGITFAAPA